MPLPDAVCYTSGTDGRLASRGVAEWPTGLKVRTATVADRVYARRGGYSAGVHRSDHSGGGCPFTVPEPAVPELTGSALAECKAVLTGDLDDLVIPWEDDGDAVLIPERPDPARRIAALAGSPLSEAYLPAPPDVMKLLTTLAGARVSVTYQPGRGIRIPIGTPGDNDRVACALAGGAYYLHRAWRNRKTLFTSWPEPLRGRALAIARGNAEWVLDVAGRGQTS